MKGQPIIDVRGVHKRFGTVEVLKDVSLGIEQSQVTCIIGPSGSGKSTLLRCIAFLEKYDAGEIFIEGELLGYVDERGKRRDASDREIARVRRNVGFVFQQYHLLDDLTVYENLEIPLSYRRYSKSERAALVADALDRFQIVGKKDLYPRQLSGGQQQLVGVARAIIAEPKLLLADEPTGNLHSSQGEEIMELFRKLNEEGMTIVQVTHSDKNASYGKRVIQLRDGWIVNK